MNTFQRILVRCYVYSLYNTPRSPNIYHFQSKIREEPLRHAWKASSRAFVSGSFLYFFTPTPWLCASVKSQALPAERLANSLVDIMIGLSVAYGVNIRRGYVNAANSGNQRHSRPSASHCPSRFWSWFLSMRCTDNELFLRIYRALVIMILQPFVHHRTPSLKIDNSGEKTFSRIDTIPSTSSQ